MDALKFMKVFDGTGDVDAWLRKTRLTAKMVGIADLATVLPLLLEGSAFAVYQHMDPVKQQNAGEIEKALLDAFSIGQFEAYEKLRTKVWAGEPADVFLADIRNLAERAGVAGEETLKCAFVVGLPSDVSGQLRSSSRIASMKLEEVVAQARALLSNRLDASGFSAIRKTHVSKALRRDSERSRQTLVCWSCGLEGHYARNCPSKVSGNERREVVAPAASQ